MLETGITGSALARNLVAKSWESTMEPAITSHEAVVGQVSYEP